MGKRRQRAHHVTIPENGNGLDHERVGAAASLLQLADLSAHRSSQSQNSRNNLNMASSAFTPSSVKEENSSSVSSNSSTLPLTNSNHSNHLHFSQSLSAALMASSAPSSFSIAITSSPNSVMSSGVDIHPHTPRIHPAATPNIHPHASNTHHHSSDVRPGTYSIHPNTSDSNPHTAGISPQTSGVHPQASSIHPNTSDSNPHTAGISPQTSGVHPHASSIHPNTSDSNPHTTGISPQTSGVHPQASSIHPHTTSVHLHTSDILSNVIASDSNHHTSNTHLNTTSSSLIVRGSLKSTPSPSPLVVALTSQTNYSQLPIRSDNHSSSALNLAMSGNGATGCGKEYTHPPHQHRPGNGVGNHDNADVTNSPQTNTSSVPSPLDHQSGPSSASSTSSSSSASSSSSSSAPSASLVASLTQMQLLAQSPGVEAAVAVADKSTSSVEKVKSSNPKKSSRTKRSSPADPKRVAARKRTNSIGSDDGPNKKKAYIPSYVQEGEKCVVCNDNSTGTHYRAMTCEGCKGFFRRTIQNNNHTKYTCKFQQNCVIDKNNRNQCQFCRFKKCLDAKMDPESVLSEPERQNLRFLIATNRQERKKKVNMVLTPEESEALALIGENFLSPRMSAFFTFFPDLNEEQHKPRMEDVQASIEHLVRFINCLPGVETEIIQNDVLALMHSRILDIVAFRLAYCFDLTTNELVMENRRISEPMLKQYSWMDRIFHFAKFYARFTTGDGIVLGTLCAIRFFNTDNIPLTNDVAVNNICSGLQLMFVKYICTEKRSLMHQLFSNLANFENIRQEDALILIRLAMLDSYSRRIPDDQLEVEAERGEPDENGKKEKVTIQLSPYIIDLNRSSNGGVVGTGCPASDRVMRSLNSDRPDLVAAVTHPRAREDSRSSGPSEEYISDSQSISSKSGSVEAFVDDDCKVHEASFHPEPLPPNEMRMALAPVPCPVSLSGSVRIQPRMNSIGSTVTQPRSESQALIGLAREQLARIAGGPQVTQRLSEDSSHQHALSDLSQASPLLRDHRVSAVGRVKPGNGQALDLRNGESSQMLRSDYSGGLAVTDTSSPSAESPNLSLDDLRRPRPPMGLNQLEIMDHLIKKNRLLEERLKEFVRNERAKEVYQEQQQPQIIERSRSPFLEDLHRLRQHNSQRYEAEEQIGQPASHREMQQLLLSQNTALPLTVPGNGSHFRDRSHSSPDPRSRFTSLDSEDRYQPTQSYSHEIHPITRNLHPIPDGATHPTLLPLSNRAQVSSHPPPSSSLPISRTVPQPQHRVASSILSILQIPPRADAPIPPRQNPVPSFSNLVSNSTQQPQFGATHQSPHPEPHVVHLSNTPSQSRHFLKHKDHLNGSPSQLSSDYPSPHDLSISSIPAVPYTRQLLERNSMTYRPEEPRGHAIMSSHSGSAPQSTSLPTASPSNSQEALFNEVVNLRTHANLPLPANLQKVPTPAEEPSPTGFVESGSKRRGSFSTPSPSDSSTSHRGLKKRWLVRHSTEGNSSNAQNGNK